MLRALLPVVLLPILLLALVPASASARDLYTSPSGPLAASSPCTQAEPCGIGRASLNAQRDDIIRIGPGSYGTSATPLGFGIGTEAVNAFWIGHPDATLYIDNGGPSSSCSARRACSARA